MDATQRFFGSKIHMTTGTYDNYNQFYHKYESDVQLLGINSFKLSTLWGDVSNRSKHT